MNNQKGQALVEYVLILALVTAVFTFFYRSYKDEFLGEEGFLSTIINTQTGSEDFKKFKIYR